MSFLKTQRTAAVGAGAFLVALTESLRATGKASEAIAGKAVSMESLSAADEAELLGALESSTAVIGQAYGQAMGGQLSIAQEEAALGALAISAAPARFIGTDGRYSDEALSRSAGVQGNVLTHVIPATGVAGRADKRVGFESYDAKDNRQVGAYSVSYNVAASRQVEAGELFYPTVVVAPNQAGYNVNVRSIYAFDALTRDASGALNKFNRKNVLKALVDKSILATEQTKLIPVFRNSGGIDSSANFVAAITPVSVTTADGETFLTAPLAVGKKFSLLGISQTAAQLAAGSQNQTDAVDTARLQAVYIKLTDGTTTEYIKVDTSSLPGADYNAAVQGNTELLQLVLNSDAVLLTAATKTVAGTAATLLAGLGANSARASIGLSGQVVRDKGDCSMMADSVSIVAMNDADGNPVSYASGGNATIAGYINNAVIVGYDLLAYRSNANRRNQGKLLDFQEVNFLFNVPLLSPLAMARPMMSDDSKDAQMLADLVAVTRIQTANAFVTELLRTKDTLAAFASAGDNAVNNPQIFGPASLMVDPAFVSNSLDVAASIDSRTTSERIADLRTLLVNKIRDIATKLYIKSNYGPALEAYYAGQNKKPIIIVVCDPEIANYINILGDSRIAGDMFDIKVSHAFDERMKGKVYLSFGVQEAEGSGVPTPLHFGNMAWRAELTAILPATRQGANSLELTVCPSYRHVTNLPILGEITVTNLGAVIAGKVATNMHTV